MKSTQEKLKQGFIEMFKKQHEAICDKENCEKCKKFEELLK